MKEARSKSKAVVVGGSIAGISCAHALIAAGWDVVVLEKTSSPRTGCATGAGLGLDLLSQRLLESWIKQPELIQLSSLPLTIDHERATDGNKNRTWTLTRDDEFNFRAFHWADLHDLLYNSLPPEIVLWGHLFHSFCIPDDKSCVKVKANVLQTGETVEFVGDLLVAADGCLSSIRKTFIPDLELRYSGYCAWRGVLDFSENEDSETILALKKAYPDLGKCNYFDVGLEGHAILYELINKRVNWIWYLNQPEPDFKVNSVTMKVSHEMIENMSGAAENVWIPELVKLMRETKDPFLNAIYDSEPLEQYFWDNVVLIGEAAHPISPHGARSTNMSILDAAVLGKCLEKWGLKNLDSALEEYQSIRMPVNKEQVLFSRRMGRIKQRLALSDRDVFDPMTASEEECMVLQLRNIPYFDDIPSDPRANSLMDSDRCFIGYRRMQEEQLSLSLPQMRQMCDVYLRTVAPGMFGGSNTYLDGDFLHEHRDVAESALNAFNNAKGRNFKLVKFLKCNDVVTLFFCMTFHAKEDGSDECLLFRAVVNVVGADNVLLCEIRLETRIWRMTLR